MKNGRRSDAVYWQLMRNAMRPKTGGTVDGLNEKAGRSRNGAARQVTSASREEMGGLTEPSLANRDNQPVLRLVSSRQSVRTIARKPCLRLIDGGLC